MDPKTYHGKREQLVGLLKKTSNKLAALSAQHQDMKLPELERERQEIDRICTRVYEDQFRIALVSKFQGGKSTTFNALADGMEISPCGDGAIACSAAVIHAWNVEDPAQAGVEVVWRTKQELVCVVAELLEKEFTDLDVNRFAGKSPSEMGEMLDLDKQEDLALLRTAVACKVKEYLNNQRDFPLDDFPVLVIAVIISRYYGQDFLLQARAASYSPATVGSLIRFPANYKTSIAALLQGQEVFGQQELLFAFVREVKCRLHKAAGLREIGALVTDSPGLSASAYDTRVAMGIFAESDAVWYLLDGKQVGALETDDIRRAFQAASSSMFATTNLKGDVNPARRNIEQGIVPAQRAQLRNAGIPIRDEEPRVYHALLALLAVQGARLVKGKLGEDSAQELMKRAADWGLPAGTPREAWIGLVEECLHRLRVPGTREFGALSEALSDAGIAIVRRESCLDDTLSAIKRFVLDRKVHAIFLTGGVDRAIAAMETGIEKPLQSREKGAAERVDEARERLEARKTALTEFYKDAQDILEPLNSETPDLKLAEDLLDTAVIPAVAVAARGAAPRVARQMGVWTTAWSMFEKWRNKEDRQEAEIRKIISEEVQKAALPYVQAWAKEMDGGTNRVLRDCLLNTVDRLRTRLMEKWSRQPGDLKDALPLPVGAHLDTAADIATVHASLSRLAWTQTFQEMGIGLSIVLVIAGLAFLIPGIGPIFTAVVAAVLILIKKVFIDKASFEHGIEDEIGKGLTAALKPGGNHRDLMLTELTERVTCRIRKGYLKLFESALEKQRTVFDEQYERTRNDLDCTETERKRIAEECHRIRTCEVEPLRKELQAFRAEVLPLL